MDHFQNYLVNLFRKIVFHPRFFFVESVETQCHNIQYTPMDGSSCSIVQQVAHFPLRRAAKRAIDTYVLPYFLRL